jgi:hypothetical protein
MPDVSTEVAIATTTVSGATDITFSSISSSYTDLRIIFVGTESTSNFFQLQFNGDTATNYSRTDLVGDGSAASSARATSQTLIQLRGNLSSTIPSFVDTNIFSYTGSTNKTVLINSSTDFNGSGQTRVTVGLWRSTSSITSVKIFGSGGTLTGTATLYGIL